ncbi:MAG: hypothetical protein P8126_12710, partial [Gammaproteobacteria bacterium]
MTESVVPAVDPVKWLDAHGDALFAYFHIQVVDHMHPSLVQSLRAAQNVLLRHPHGVEEELAR